MPVTVITSVIHLLSVTGSYKALTLQTPSINCYINISLQLMGPCVSCYYRNGKVLIVLALKCVSECVCVSSH